MDNNGKTGSDIKAITVYWCRALIVGPYALLMMLFSP